MLDKQRLGLEIKKQRKKRNLTQKELASNICNQSEISRIEKGNYLPSTDVLYLIATKLSIPISYFFEVLIHEERELTSSLEKKVNDLTAKKEYGKVYQYTSEILFEHTVLHPETKKFLQWQKLIAAFHLKKIDVKKCIYETELLLREEVVGTNILMNLYIKNSLANLFAEDKKYEKSSLLYEEIMSESQELIGIERFRIKIFYNYGKLHYLKNNFAMSLNLTERGIELAQQAADMSLIGQLYYQKGSIQEQMNLPKDLIALTFQKAFFFFEILELQVLKKILLEHKSHFLK